MVGGETDGPKEIRAKSETGADYEEISNGLIKSFLQFSTLRWQNKGSKMTEHKHILRHSEMMVLFAISDLEKKNPGGVSVSDLGRLLRVKSPTITPSINSLEEKGMLERKIDRNDRRVMRISLTPQGRDCLRKMMDHFVVEIRGLVEYLGSDKSRRLADILEDVYRYFGGSCAHPSKPSQTRDP